MALADNPNEIKFSEIFNEENDQSGSVVTADQDISLNTLSTSFGNNASVVNVARSLLTGDEDKISHFHGARFPGNFENITLYLGAPASNQLLSNNSSEIVEGERLGIEADNVLHMGDDSLNFTVQVSDGSAVGGSGNSGVTGTANDTAGSPTYEFSTILDINDEEGSSLRVKLEDANNSFDTNFSDLFTYRRQITGASLGSNEVSLVDSTSEAIPPETTLNATSTVGVVTSTTGTTVTNLQSGDGGTTSATANAPVDGVESYEITNYPGKVRFTTIVRGRPTGTSRNQQTGITKEVDVRYREDITDVGVTNTSNILTGASKTFEATSKGVSNGSMQFGYSTANDDTTYTDSTTVISLNTFYFKSDQSQALDVDHSSPNSSTSTETIYPKAHYTSGASSNQLTAGSSFLVYPNLVYTPSGNKAVDVNGSAQTFSATLQSGVGAGMTISSNFNGTTASGFGPTLSLTPSTNNGVFTITYTGTATLNSNNVQTNTFTVRPDITLSADVSSVYSMPETGDQPTGTYAEDVSLTTSEVGANNTGRSYNWSFPGALTGWQTLTGGGTGDSTATGNFSSGLRGSEEADSDEDITITLTKNGATSLVDTDSTVTISVIGLDNQALSNFVLLSSTTVRRGDSNGISFTFRYKNIETVDISFPLKSAGNSSANSLQANLAVNGDSSPNTLLTHSTITKNVPEFARTTTGLYRVNVRDDADTSPNVYSSDITVKDKEPTTPGSFTTTAGGYSGDQAITWGASDYAARYKVYRDTSSGGSFTTLYATTATADDPTESVTITADATDTQNHYYKVLAENDNSYVDNNGGASTSDEQSSKNSAVQYIIYPVANNSKNTIADSGTVIRTTRNNSTSTTHTFGTPGTQTDSASFVQREYTLQNNPVGVTLSNATTTTYTTHNTIINSSANSGTSTVRLTTTVEGGNDPDTTGTSDATIYHYHYPKITQLTINQATVRKGVTEVTCWGTSAFQFQGYRKAGVTALTVSLRVVNDSGTVVNENGTLTPSELFDDAHLTPQSIADLVVVNLGMLSGASVTSTCRLQANFNNNNIGTDPNPGWETVDTFSVEVPVTIDLFQARDGLTSTTIDTDFGYHSTPEDAYLDNTGTTGGLFQFTTFPSTDDEVNVGDGIFVEQGDGGFDTLNGENKWYSINRLDGSTGTVNRDVFLLGTDGIIDTYYDQANVPPKAPTGGSSSVSTTSTVSAMTSPANYTWGKASGTNITLTTTDSHVITYSWSDNSSIEDSYQVSYEGGAYETADSSTSHSETETSTGTYSLVVKAVNGTSSSSTITIDATVSAGSGETLYFVARRYVSAFVNPSIPAQGFLWTSSASKNAGTTSTTTFNLGGCDTPPPISGETYNGNSSPSGLNQYQYKLECRRASYTGTILQTSNAFDVAINDGITITDSGGAAGAYIPDVQDFADGTAYWYGNESSGVQDFSDDLGEWTGADTVYTYMYINDSTNYKMSGSATGVGYQVSFQKPTAGGGNVLHHVHRQQTGTTLAINPSNYTAYDGTTSETFTTITSGNEFDNPNDKKFFVMELRNQITVFSSDEQDWVLKIKSPGYTTKSYTLTLEIDENATGSGTCFIVGTQVMLSNGTWKNIEDITFEDSIKSIALPNAINSDDFEVYGGWEETSLEGMTEEVSEPVFISRDTFYDYYKLTLEDDSEIKVTWEHPFVIYRDNVYKWSKAEDLVIGDKLVTKDDTKVTIELIEEIVQDDEFVTLDIEDVDTYLVKAGENAFIVHNPDKGSGS